MLLCCQCFSVLLFHFLPFSRSHFGKNGTKPFYADCLGLLADASEKPIYLKCMPSLTVLNGVAGVALSPGVEGCPDLPVKGCNRLEIAFTLQQLKPDGL